MTKQLNQLIAIRRPSLRERRHGAQIVFERLHDGRKETIYASTCYEGWQQWGAACPVLSANVETVEEWRRGNIPGFVPSTDGGAS